MEKRKQSKAEKKFLDDFYNLMTLLGLHNLYNRTYKLQILDETNYGYFAHLYLSTGLSYDVLQDKRKVIEQNLRCLWVMKAEQLKEYAEVQIVTNPIDHEYEFEAPKIKPWQMWLGLSFAQKVIMNDNNKSCMFLIAGATGSGKTRYIYMILLSWILNCSPQNVWLYISDIAKNEYINFQNVKHVKYYASELDELYSMMQAIGKEFNRRKKIISQFRAQGLATNIEEYNKLGNKLPYCYMLIDEFSVIVPDKSDSKGEKEQKEYILAMLKTLSKTGRSMGIFCIIATQKTTRDEIPSILKNMSAVRVSFRANDAISSEVIMGDNSAMGLTDRIAVYSQNGGSIQNYLFSPKLTITRLNELLKPHIKNNKKTPTQGRHGLIRGKVTVLPKTAGNNVLQLFDKGDEYSDY